MVSCDGLGAAVELMDVSNAFGGTGLLLRGAPAELSSYCKNNLLWEGPAWVAPPGSVPLASTSIGSVVAKDYSESLNNKVTERIVTVRVGNYGSDYGPIITVIMV